MQRPEQGGAVAPAQVQRDQVGPRRQPLADGPCRQPDAEAIDQGQRPFAVRRGPVGGRGAGGGGAHGRDASCPWWTIWNSRVKVKVWKPRMISSRPNTPRWEISLRRRPLLSQVSSSEASSANPT